MFSVSKLIHFSGLLTACQGTCLELQSSNSDPNSDMEGRDKKEGRAQGRENNQRLHSRLLGRTRKRTSVKLRAVCQSEYL